MLNFFMYGITNMSWWGYFAVTLIFTQLTIFGVTIYLHRYQAHRSIEMHPIVAHIFRFWLWLTTGMVTKEWAAIHRLHHARVETYDDPHSPIAKGIRKVFFYGSELYRDAAKNKASIEQYGHGTPDDWIERNLYSKHCSLGIYLMLAIDFLLFGMAGVTIWAIQMIWIPLFAAGIVNGIGHYWGYRNFECQDASRNIIPIGFFIGGEELHNNHHTYATSAKFSVKPWEFDIGWQVIRLLQFFKLAKVKRLPPKVELIPSKNSIDKATIKAVINSRFELMAQYTKKVLLPMLRDIKQQASISEKKFLGKAKVLLIRDSQDDFAKNFLQFFLNQHARLKTVYQFKLKLQAIWNQKTLSSHELIEVLQDWCTQADATGIETLNRFSNYLKSYTLKPLAI